MRMEMRLKLSELEARWQIGMSEEDVLESPGYARWSAGQLAPLVVSSVSHRTRDGELTRWLRRRVSGVIERTGRQALACREGRYRSDFERWWLSRERLWEEKALAAYESNAKAGIYSPIHKVDEVPMSVAERHWWGYVHQAYARNGYPLAGAETGELRTPYKNAKGHLRGRLLGLTVWREVDVLSVCEAWEAHRRNYPEDYIPVSGVPYTSEKRHRLSEKDWWEPLSVAEILRGMLQEERILKGKRGLLYAKRPELRLESAGRVLQRHLFRERVGMPEEARRWVEECYRLNYGPIPTPTPSPTPEPDPDTSEPSNTSESVDMVRMLWCGRPIEGKEDVREWGTVELIWSLCYVLNRCYANVDRYLGMSKSYSGNLVLSIRTEDGGYKHLNPRTTPATRRRLEEAVYGLHPEARPQNASRLLSEKTKAHRSSTQATLLQVEKRLFEGLKALIEHVDNRLDGRIEHINRRLDRIEHVLEALLGSGEGVSLGDTQKTVLNVTERNVSAANGTASID